MRIKVFIIYLITSVILCANSDSVDPSFGTNGVVLTEIGEDYATANAIDINRDGKIFVTGTSRINGKQNYTLVCYDANGTLDKTFGKDQNGTVFTQINSGDAYARDLAIQESDGKIVVVGSERTNHSFAVVRYESNGTLDKTFGENKNGIVTTYVSDWTQAESVAIQTDGKIVTVGNGKGVSDTVNGFAIVRYETNGTIDTIFGENKDGIVITQVTDGYDKAKGIAIQNDSKIIVVGGVSNSMLTVIRYDSNGTLDPTFGENKNGIVQISTGLYDNNTAYDVTVQNDGKIIVVGKSSHFIIVRFNSNGTLDSNFGTNGVISIEPAGRGGGYATSVTLQNDGKIVAAGWSYNGTDNDFITVQYNSDGSPDVNFGNNGIVIEAFNSDAGANGVAVQCDGKIVTTGQTKNINDNNVFTTIRYKNDSPNTPTVILTPIYYLLQ